MPTWMSYIVAFLTGRRTARHWLISREFGRRRNFLISMKADLRQTLVSSCSPSFCIVLVGVGFLEKQISELNSQLLMNLFFSCHFWTIFYLIVHPGHLTSQSSLHQRLAGLYCLYCLYECQPYKPQFKIYLSLGKAYIFKPIIWCFWIWMLIHWNFSSIKNRGVQATERFCHYG